MKHKKLTIALVASMVATILMVATLSVYAYFTTRVYVYTEDGKEVAHVGMNLQLLFGKLSGVTEGTDLKIPSYNVVDANGTIVTVTENNATYWANVAGTGQYLHYNDGVNDKTTYDPDAPWGSAQNPYVISETRHLQNLSALQSVGYFDLLYVANNFDANGNYIPGSASIPYFLICTDTTSATTGAVAGTPVTIDGSALDSPIKPIGSAEHPFIGVIGGAFNTTDSPTTTVAGKTSSVSTIHGFKIQTNTNQTDVGLFGYVGFLGNEPTAAQLAESMKVSTYVPAFEGVFSSIQNMLISDVSVTVASPTLGESISALFEPFWQTFFAGANQPTDKDGNIILHRFTFSDMTVGDVSTFHETHHIGIFAGHVSYAMIDRINVYYSNETTHALDVTGTSEDDNYYSASGILGMMYNMNCTVENQATTANNTTTFSGNCRVLLGTGTSGDEIGGGGEGTGTGGGALSGNGRGYVTAAEIFDDFNEVDVSQRNNELLWKYRTTADGAWTENAILILKKKDGSGYTLLDGKTTATVNGNSVSATINGATATWTNFFIREIYQDTAGNDMLRYITPGGTAVRECELMGNKDKGQTIWKFSAGGDGIWHYGILVKKNGDSYTLEDGTAVDFDNTNNLITYGTNVWKSFFIVEDVDGTQIPFMYDPTLQQNWTVSVYERKPMTLIEAYRINAETGAQEELCIEWMRQRIFGGTEATGLYYFYDGVFTFALSSAEDTIRDTWENNDVPDLYLGADSADAWEVNPQRGNKALVSLLKLVTNNKELDLAIQEGKQFYITAQPTTTDAYLMSLLTENANGKPGAINGQALKLENTLREELWLSYYGGAFYNLPTAPNTLSGENTMTVEYVENGVLKSRPVTLEDMKTEEFWDDYTVLNVGRTNSREDLTFLKEKFNVAAENANEDYYFRTDTDVPVSPEDGVIPAYQAWEGYFFYKYTTTNTYTTFLGTKFYDTTFHFTFYYQGPGNVEAIEIGTGSYEKESNVSIDTLGNAGSPWPFLPEYATNVINEQRWFTAGTASYGVQCYTQFTSDSRTINVSTEGCRWYDPTVENPADAWNTTNQIPLLNLQDGSKFHGDTEVALVDGYVVSHKTTITTNYYYYDVLADAYYTASNALISNIETYDKTGKVELYKYPSYVFSDSSLSSNLQILNQYAYTTIWGNSGDSFSIWAGTGTQYTNLDLEKDHADKGVLVFVEGEDYCYIRYAIDTDALYVNYTHNSSTKETQFAGTAAKNDTTKLYVYIIEGVIDMDFGVNTFIPTDINAEDSTSHKLSANSVVFWPQTTLTQTGYNTNSGYKTSITATASNDINAKKYVTPDPTYSIVPLTGTNGLNWGTKDGYKLGDYGLDKKFQMADEAAFGTLINIGDWSIPIGDANTLVAPVGSNGVNATIPKGCVAFRVNAGGTQTIRIIVAVPTTDYYLGESGFDLDRDMDYYVGVWQVAAAGDEILSRFSKADALEKFELPRSYTFDFNDSPTSIEPEKDENGALKEGEFKTYVNVQYGGQNYRTYLNGDCFLVAYEFTIDGGTDGGVFVIGSVHGDESSSSGKEVPMEIVHFSVSGTASAGRDGVTGNQLGAIDFVYDDTLGNIATIDKNDSQTGPTNGTEYYSNYYASQCLLYSNNEQKDSSGNYLLLNKEKVWIRRYVDNSTPNSAKTIMAYQVSGQVPDSFLVKQYAINSDEVEKNE